MEKKRIVLCGGGPHSKVVLDLLLEDGGYEVVGVLDAIEEAPFGVPVIGTDADMARVRASGVDYAFCAVGSNAVRAKVCAALKAAGFILPTIVAPDAVLSRRCQIGAGVLVNHGAIVNAGATIGDGVILNTGCTVDHDCVIDDYAHIAPGVHISGSTRVGPGSFLGVGCCVKDKIVIGEDAVIGAGAAVVGNIPPRCTAVGVPARVIKQR